MKGIVAFPLDLVLKPLSLRERKEFFPGIQRGLGVGQELSIRRIEVQDPVIVAQRLAAIRRLAECIERPDWQTGAQKQAKQPSTLPPAGDSEFDLVRGKNTTKVPYGRQGDDLIPEAAGSNAQDRSHKRTVGT